MTTSTAAWMGLGLVTAGFGWAFGVRGFVSWKTSGDTGLRTAVGPMPRVARTTAGTRPALAGCSPEQDASRCQREEYDQDGQPQARSRRASR